MRVERSPVSSHQYGMSSVWHDPDYVPEQHFKTPRVQKDLLADLALPGEQHQLPEGVADPYAKLEAVYQIAAAQMERGLAGTLFLNGRTHLESHPVAEAADPHRLDDDLVRGNAHGPRKGTAADRQLVETMRADIEQLRLVNQAVANTIPKVKGASTTAAEREAAQHAPQVGDANAALAAVGTMVPMAVIMDPLPALPSAVPLATPALTATTAATGAAHLALDGLAEDEPLTVRRGLRLRA